MKKKKEKKKKKLNSGMLIRRPKSYANNEWNEVVRKYHIA